MDEGCNWVNINLNVKRVISISTVLCHSGNSGMITIYYDKSSQLNVDQYLGYKLMYKVLRSTDDWPNQRNKTIKLA